MERRYFSSILSFKLPFTRELSSLIFSRRLNDKSTKGSYVLLQLARQRAKERERRNEDVSRGISIASRRTLARTARAAATRIGLRVVWSRFARHADLSTASTRLIPFQVYIYIFRARARYIVQERKKRTNNSVRKSRR